MIPAFTRMTNGDRIEFYNFLNLKKTKDVKLSFLKRLLIRRAIAFCLRSAAFRALAYAVISPASMHIVMLFGLDVTLVALPAISGPTARLACFCMCIHEIII